MNIEPKNIAVPLMISVGILVFGSWFTIDCVKNWNPKDVVEFYQMAGQFGDRFGFINSIFGAITVFLLIINYAITKSAYKIQMTENANSLMAAESRNYSEKVTKLLERIDYERKSIVFIDKNTGLVIPGNDGFKNIFYGFVSRSMVTRLFVAAATGQRGMEARQHAGNRIKEEIPFNIGQIEVYYKLVGLLGDILTEISSNDKSAYLRRVVYSSFGDSEILAIRIISGISDFDHLQTDSFWKEMNLVKKFEYETPHLNEFIE